MIAEPATTSSTGRLAHRRRAGLTLIELLVVLAVIGLVVGMSVPALSRYAGSARLKSATRQLVGLVSLARSLAIGSRAGHAVVFDAAQRRVFILNAQTEQVLDQHILHLPETMTVSLDAGGEPVPDGRITFRPSGALTGRTITVTLTDKDRRQTITVTGPTGAVHVD